MSHFISIDATRGTRSEIFRDAYNIPASSASLSCILNDLRGSTNAAVTWKCAGVSICNDNYCVPTRSDNLAEREDTDFELYLLSSFVIITNRSSITLRMTLMV